MAGWRGGERAMLQQLRTTTQERLDDLKDAFFALDQSQRAVRTAVEAFTEILPERAARSGLVPRYRVVDAEAEQHLAEYLALLDRYGSVDALAEQDLRAANPAMAQLAPRLRAVSAQLDALLETYEGEFTLVARETRKIEDRRRAAAGAVAEAQRLWEGLRAQGLESAAADTAFAKARVAQRGVDAWTPTAGHAELDQLVGLVEGFVAEVREVVEHFPAQVARAQRRVPSLRTRLEAVLTRSERVPGDLGALRREFSTGNWLDLEHRQREVRDLVGTARAAVDRVQAAVASQSWQDAVDLLTEAEHAVQVADDAVDEPHDRLQALREVKAAPSAALDRARFSLRDAQTLVVRGRLRETQDIVTHLDALARQLDALRPALDAVHPDYWSVLSGAERIEREVAGEVARYRERLRAQA